MGGKPYADTPDHAALGAKDPAVKDWPLVVVVDDVEEATASSELFLWTVFTRVEPAGALWARSMSTERFHVGLEPPIVFDARMRPSYPPVLEVDDATRELVDRRWDEYGIPLG